MVKKWIIGLIALVTVIGFAGVGFATLTSNNIYINGTAQPGTFGLVWDTWAGGIDPVDGNWCVVTWQVQANTGNTVAWMNVTKLTPGDSCSVDTEINDTGNLPAASLTDTYATVVTTPAGTPCSTTLSTNCIQVSDSLGITLLGGITTATVTGSPYEITAGGSVAYDIHVDLPVGSSFPSTDTLSFTITIYGTV